MTQNEFNLFRCNDGVNIESHSSVLGIASFLIPFTFKPLIKKYGRLPLIITCQVLNALFIACLGIAQLISNNGLFISSTIFSRTAESFVSMTSISITMFMIPTYYQKPGSYLTIQILGLQLADLCGPLWTGLLFKYLNYVGVFLTLALLPLLSALLLCYFRSEDRKYPYVQKKEAKTITYFQVLKVPGVLIGVLGFISAEAFYVTIDPILPYKLSREFGYNEQQIGVFFFHFTVIVASVTVLMVCVPEKLNKLPIILTGAILMPIGAFLTGPSKLLGLPNKVSVMTAGMALAGAGKALIESFFTVFMMQSASRAFQDQQEQARLRVPPIIGLSFSISVFILPMSMSIIYKATNFSTALDIIGCLFLLNMIIISVLSVKANCGRESIQKKEEQDDERKLLKPEREI